MSPWRWKGRRSFLMQIVLSVVVPIGLVLIAFTLIAASLHQQAMRDLVARRDLRTARLLARLWEAQWASREAALNNVVRMLEHGFPMPPHAREARPMSAALLTTIFDRGLFWVAPDGRAWQLTEGGWTEVDPPFPPETLQTPWRWARRGPDHDPVVWFRQPLGDGWLLGGFSLVSLGTFGALALEPPTTLAVVDAQTQPLLVYVGPWPEGWEKGLRLQGKEGTWTSRLANDEEYVIAYVRLRPTGWYLVLGEPWEATTNLWLRASEWIPLSLIPILLVSLVLLWLGNRNVVRPLQDLERRAHAVAWGRAEALAEPVGGIEEIRRLQRTLYHMARRLQQAHQSLRGYLAALTAGQEEERRRLARDLHDETLQALIALQQRIQLAAQDAEAFPQLQARLQTLQDMVAQLVQDLRRLIRDLRPLYLEELGLIPALESLARETTQAHPELRVEFLLQGEPRRLKPEQELALYRITQEALNNVLRHARATHAQIILAFEPRHVLLEIRDNGQGFVVPESPAELAAQGHYGLLGMQERAERLGARFRVHSEPGQGTLISVRMPLGPESEPNGQKA